MSRITAIVNAILRVVIVLAFVVLVVCVVWQVFSRYVLGTPSTVTDEMARFLFIWVALLGGAYTLGQRRHLAIDLLTSQLSGPPKRLVDGLIVLAVAGFATLVMVYGGSQLVAKTLSSGQVSPALRLPMGYIYIAVPFAGLAILYYCATFLSDLIRTGRGPTDQLGPARPGGPLD